MATSDIVFFVPSLDQIFTSLTATKALVVELGLRPMLLLAEDAMEEFRDVETSDPDAVVVGLAPDKFDYASLNRAFRVLLAHRPTADTSSASSASCASSSSPSPPPTSPALSVPRLIAAHRGRFQANAGGDLDLGPGPFVAALEYATDVRSHVVGKPSPAFFEAARRLLERVRRRRVETEAGSEAEEEDGGGRLSPSSILMIGDDARDDILGAMACGWRGALVRTGKFRPGDEREGVGGGGGGGGTIEWVADSFPVVIDALLEARSTER